MHILFRFNGSKVFECYVKFIPRFVEIQSILIIALMGLLVLVLLFLFLFMIFSFIKRKINEILFLARRFHPQYNYKMLSVWYTTSHHKNHINGFQTAIHHNGLLLSFCCLMTWANSAVNLMNFQCSAVQLYIYIPYGGKAQCKQCIKTWA